MADQTAFTWKVHPVQLAAKLDQWTEATIDAVYELFRIYAPRFEAQMKQGAKWSDMTGTARSALAARVDRTPRSITLWLGFLLSEAEYFVYLEFGTRYFSPRDKYSIVQPTMEVATKLLDDGIRGILA